MTEKSSKPSNWTKKKAKKLILERKVSRVKLILTSAAKLILVIHLKNTSMVMHNMILAMVAKNNRCPRILPVYYARARRSLRTISSSRWKKWKRNRWNLTKTNANIEK